jgi:anti-sigma factor RsiW
MTEDRVSALIAAFGADPARWPEDERAAACAMLASSERLRAELAGAAMLDDRLDALRDDPFVSLPDERLAAMAARIEDRQLENRERVRMPPKRRSLGLLPSEWGSLAAACVFGVVLGLSTPFGASDDTDQWLYDVGLSSDLVAWDIGEAI